MTLTYKAISYQLVTEICPKNELLTKRLFAIIVVWFPPLFLDIFATDKLFNPEKIKARAD